MPGGVEPTRPAAQAVILAAGRGRRLGPGAGSVPKCLLRVGGSTLVRHQLRALADAGIHDVVIVAGFGHRQVRAAVGADAQIVLNERFAETNSLASFLRARPFVNGDVLVLNSDLFASPSLVAFLARCDGDVLLYDSSSGEDEEHMKVQVHRGRLVRMAKDLAPEQTDGENLGMLRLSARTAGAVFEAGERLMANGDSRSWLSEGVSRAAATTRIRCIDVAGTPWIEIDFPADLERARNEVYQAVRQLHQGGKGLQRVADLARAVD